MLEIVLDVLVSVLLGYIIVINICFFDFIYLKYIFFFWFCFVYIIYDMNIKRWNNIKLILFYLDDGDLMVLLFFYFLYKWFRVLM